MSFIKLTDLDLAGKRVLIRADLNVPVKDGQVTSDARIRAALPTIEAAVAAGARVILIGPPTLLPRGLGVERLTLAGKGEDEVR